MLSKDEIEEAKVGCHARLLFKKAMLRIIDKLFSEQTESSSLKILSITLQITGVIFMER